MAFHEKAGPCQVDFDQPFLESSLSFMAEGVQSGPERSRARSLRRQRTLDGEDRSITIRQEGKGAVARDFWSFLCSSVLALRPNPRCRHPSIRTLSERFIRSVQVGCSRFSRCCHLLVDLSRLRNDGSRYAPARCSDKPETSRFSTDILGVVSARAFVTTLLLKHLYIAHRPDSQNGRGRDDRC
jgi:hypothetical protein